MIKNVLKYLYNYVKKLDFEFMFCILSDKEMTFDFFNNKIIKIFFDVLQSILFKSFNLILKFFKIDNDDGIIYF
ncbi:hypothetical protein BpHYR1_046859 [Brachionus plicatilis]|uniref:Uncharacterized protein n=1 Tax=Brachionus plicatilis TaxID=10195 RepID=A0A3M7RFS1_BRAPC|nr:hypothetical protein BpHYR1_046859 [Brachionus plicatilis]